MASNRPIRGDLSGDGSFGDSGFALDWHRLFSSEADGMAPAYAGPAVSAPAVLPAGGLIEQISPAMAAAQAAASIGLDPVASLGFETSLAVPQTETFLSTVGGPLGDSYWRPSVVIGTTPVEGPAGIVLLPGGPGAAAGLLPQADALPHHSSDSDLS